MLTFPCWWIENGRCACPNGAETDHKSAGKHPITTNGVKDATDDPEQLKTWRERYPKANWGIATGGGVIVVDLDVKPGKDGRVSIRAIGSQLPTTRTVQTGSGGMHLYFKGQASNSSNKLGPGIDVRGTGGYVLAPSSNHISGGTYTLLNDVEPADLPNWLAELITAPVESDGPVAERGYFPPASPTVLETARDALDEHGPAIQGQGGDEHTFKAAALLVHDFALTDDEAWPLLEEWNADCQPPWSVRDLRAKLRGGGKYGSRPYGCRRATDAIPAVESMLGLWDRTDASIPALVAKVCVVLAAGVDAPTHAVIKKRLIAETALKSKDLKLPSAIDPVAEAVRLKRVTQFANGSPDLVDSNDMFATAKRFLAARVNDEKLTDLRRWQDETYVCRGSHDELVSDEAIRTYLYNFLEAKRDVNSGILIKPDKAMVNDVFDATKSAAFLDVPSDPAWISGTGSDPTNLVAFDNGLLDLSSRTLQPLTRRLFNRNARTFSYDSGAPPPERWLSFLNQLWPNDAESIETLQEVTGLFLTGDTSFQKLFLLIGPKRSGKGTLARVLTTLIGEANVTAPTLNGIGSHFGLEDLIGKTVAVISDARMGSRVDGAAVVENLLRISGEDSISVPRKHRTAYTAKLHTRFLMLTNELPNFLDQSGALASRFIVLRLTRSFFGQEDRALTQSLTTELPGILLWALTGLDRLRARGYIRQPKSAMEQVRQLETLASPIKNFVSERCQLQPGARAKCADLFAAWVEWTAEQGRDHAGTLQIFGRNLSAAYPEIIVTQPRVDGGKRERQYEGVRLAP